MRVCILVALSPGRMGAAGAFVNLVSLPSLSLQSKRTQYHATHKNRCERDGAGVVIKGEKNHFAGSNSHAGEEKTSLVITFNVVTILKPLSKKYCVFIAK